MKLVDGSEDLFNDVHYWTSFLTQQTPCVKQIQDSLASDAKLSNSTITNTSVNLLLSHT